MNSQSVTSSRNFVDLPSLWVAFKVILGSRMIRTLFLTILWERVYQFSVRRQVVRLFRLVSPRLVRQYIVDLLPLRVTQAKHDLTTIPLTFPPTESWTVWWTAPDRIRFLCLQVPLCQNQRRALSFIFTTLYGCKHVWFVVA